MASPRKLLANRRNALQSTGPKTPQGKAASAKNALKHGILSREVLVPGEDGDALTVLGDRLRAELQPAGELEALLVDRITAALWRLRRCGRVEAEIFAREVLRQIAERARREAKLYERSRFSIETTKVTNREGYEDATLEAENAEAQLATATLGAAFVRGSEPLSTLGRYEVTIERSLFRNLHELQRLQAARKGHPVPPAVAVDVDVGGA